MNPSGALCGNHENKCRVSFSSCYRATMPDVVKFYFYFRDFYIKPAFIK